MYRYKESMIVRYDSEEDVDHVCDAIALTIPAKFIKYTISGNTIRWTLTIKTPIYEVIQTIRYNLMTVIYSYAPVYMEVNGFPKLKS